MKKIKTNPLVQMWAFYQARSLTLLQSSIFGMFIVLSFFSFTASAHDHHPASDFEVQQYVENTHFDFRHQQDLSSHQEQFDCDMSDEEVDYVRSQETDLDIWGCTSASSQQLATVNQGNAKRSSFLQACVRSTGSEKWCSEIERPNPASRNTFFCTYGSQQPHRLIHPTESTWQNAFKAIELIQRLSSEGVCVQQIYNWWRPEPYNKNVGGAAGRHPFGTSVDVSFCSNRDAIRAFDRLCQFRKRGELRAIGYYGGTGLHIGVADHTANTWGRSCP